MARTVTAFVVTILSLLVSGAIAEQPVDELLKKIDTNRGVVAVINLPGDTADDVIRLAKASELLLYFQSADVTQTDDVRRAADAAGLLGRRIFVDSGRPDSIQLADNVADCILVAASAQDRVRDGELLRALRPRGTAFIGARRKLTKPVPKGIDEWSHPYHGPDNNPQSTDQLARGDFHTQFLAVPKFSPMPEQSVVAGGRIYKAMGHIAHKANQNQWLNTLLCINAYNGTILWKRPLPAGFMIHRNTMIATGDALYLGDDKSCHVIDGRTGKTRDQITVPAGISDGPVWKWMALRNGVLYGLVGSREIKVDTQKSARRGLGHWPWGMWKGHDYKDPSKSFGFGRTFIAVDVKTKKLLWHHRDKEFIDARGVCMNDKQVFFNCPGKFLGCLNADSGEVAWKNLDESLMEALGPPGRAQHYTTGYATSCYIKCNDNQVFFAGPQQSKMAVASARDGKLLWTHPTGNLQLILRDDAIYAAGPQRTTGARLDYATGKTLDSFPARRACTRGTGCVDSIFFRASGGTVRIMTETNTAQHIAPMRPPCQDGVIISNGHLYWGPWMCGCQLSLYGHICLGPATESPADDFELYGDALRTGGKITTVKKLDVQPGDWTSYRGNNARSDVSTTAIPDDVRLEWSAEICKDALPTAPVTAGGLVFLADRTGVVRALDRDGELVWKFYTAGPVYYPPAVARDRVYVGSADGRVYALEARTGRFLWSFRVAPRDQRIPVYGKLISRWPVAGGVVVEGDTVYAAAGIASYDGTYLVALDTVTGRLKAHNASSGTLSAKVNSGISMQGNLTIVDGELRFLAGGVYETARYDLKTLRSLNTPKVQVTSQFRTAFYPYYPAYGKYVSLEHACADGSTLCHDASYEGSLFSNLALEPPLPPGVTRAKKEAARWIRRRRGKDVKIPAKIWQDKSPRRFTSFVVSTDRLLAAGHLDGADDTAFLAAMNIKDGKSTWTQKLPALAVKGGMAVDRQGRIYVALENGQLLCFAPQKH